MMSLGCWMRFLQIQLSIGSTDAARDYSCPKFGPASAGWFSSRVECSDGWERPEQVEGVSALLQDGDNVHACRRGF
jgi:hypothetical protein